MPQGSTWGSQHRAQAETATGLRTVSLLGLVHGVLLGSEAKAGWVRSNQNRGALTSSMGVFSKKHTREGPGRRGRLDHKGRWQGHIRNLHLLVRLDHKGRWQGHIWNLHLLVSLLCRLLSRLRKDFNLKWNGESHTFKAAGSKVGKGENLKNRETYFPCLIYRKL